MTPEMKDLIERIARYNGSGPQSVFVGNLLDDLRQSRIGLQEFKAKVEEVLRGLTSLSSPRGL